MARKQRTRAARSERVNQLLAARANGEDLDEKVEALLEEGFNAIKAGKEAWGALGDLLPSIVEVADVAVKEE